MVEIKMTQEEFEILDRILSGLLHGTERLAVIAAIDKEGFSRRPEPLVRGMEIDRSELLNIIRDANQEKSNWATADELVSAIIANASVWLKEIK